VTLAASAARNRPLGLVNVTVYSMGPESSAPSPSFGSTVMICPHTLLKQWSMQTTLNLPSHLQTRLLIHSQNN
jgi:hypothetical protein